MSSRGIAPRVLASQVDLAAPWLKELPIPAAAIVRRAEEIEVRWAAEGAYDGYFELLLAAHFLTVASFCPTDVDARIRHHVWVEAEPSQVARQLDVVDGVTGWDPRDVSARTLDDPDDPSALPVSGHAGEWLSVWAGALGRALVLENQVLIDRVRERIEASLEQQARIYATIERAKGRAFDLLRAAAVLAHNAGDLSRVVELWPRRPHVKAIQARYFELGHGGADRFGGAFVRAGIVNKALTSVENHRFLAMRAARGLRRSPTLLLPIGPFFDDWGARVAQTPLLEEEDRADAVGGLLETHLRGPDQLGCLRALAAIHQHAPGGLEGLAHGVPARLRKLIGAGPVRDAMKTSRATFEGRYAARAKAVIESAR